MQSLFPTKPTYLTALFCSAQSLAYLKHFKCTSTYPKQGQMGVEYRIFASSACTM